MHRANPYIELGISIVGGNETPLINIVIQEVYRDGVIARDGRLLAGDQILQVSFDLSHLSPHVSLISARLWRSSFLQVKVQACNWTGHRHLCPQGDLSESSVTLSSNSGFP